MSRLPRVKFGSKVAMVCCDRLWNLSTNTGRGAFNVHRCKDGRVPRFVMLSVESGRVAWMPQAKSLGGAA